MSFPVGELAVPKRVTGEYRRLEGGSVERGRETGASAWAHREQYGVWRRASV